VPKAVPVTAGRPYSRHTIAAWLIIPPMSVTVAPIFEKIGAHDGAVSGATRISPSCTSPIWSADWMTRAGPSATPGEAANPLRPPPSPAAGPQPHADRVRGDPPEHDGEGLGDHVGRAAERRGRRPFLQHRQDGLAALELAGPVGAAPRLGPDRPCRVHVPERLVDLVSLQVEDVVLVGEEALLDEHRAQLAHLPPDHRVAPVLDVEVVVLDIREHDSRQPQLLLERLPVLVGPEQLAYSPTIRSRSARTASVGRARSTPWPIFWM
jgi:hypothetical protein